MKKIISTSPLVLFIFYSLIPVFYLFGIVGSYSLKLRFGEELMAVFGIYSLVVLLNLNSYPIEKDKVNVFLGTQLFALAFFSSLIAISYCKSIGCIIFSACCILCSTQVFRACVTKEDSWKIYKPIAALLGLILGIYSLVMVTVPSYDKITETYLSPTGVYTARIATADNSSTVSIIETDRRIELYVFYYEDFPRTITIEHPEDTDSVDVSFTDDNTLVVNGISYSIH